MRINWREIFKRWERKPKVRIGVFCYSWSEKYGKCGTGNTDYKITGNLTAQLWHDIEKEIAAKLTADNLKDVSVVGTNFIWLEG